MFRSVLAATILTAATVSAAEPAHLVMEPMTIRDPMVNNMVAGSFLKPQGWTVRGGIKWYPNLFHQANWEVVVANPNTWEQIEVHPIATCCQLKNPVIAMPRLHNYMGSYVCEPLSPSQVVTEFTIPLTRKVAVRISQQRNMPELAELCRKLYGGDRWQVTRTRVTYTLNSTSIEEDFYTGCYFNQEQWLGVNNASILNWGIGLSFSLRAEAGQLDQATPRMLAVIHSVRANLEHLKQVNYVQGLFMQRMGLAIKAAGDLSRQISANNDYALSLMRQARASKWASEDRISRNFSDYIRGTQEYTGGGYSYSLPSGYNQAWLNSNGTVLLSNSAGFDPNTTNTGSWTELNQVR